MNLISIEQVARSFGERILFKDISFGINKGQKIGLIAENGSGKSSLLDIIAGKTLPDQGQVNYRKDMKLAFLAQEPELNNEWTIEETLTRADHPMMRVITAYEHALLHPEDEKSYQVAFEAMERSSAWDFEFQYQQILSRLKLEDLTLKVGNMSGGQKKRLALALALLETPDVLLLDEPTNHLDLEMIEWLEAYFAKEKMTLFMVTHDRYFLERVCDQIIELDRGELYHYSGNYSYFLEKRQERLALEALMQHKNDQVFKSELDWIRRQPKARTTKSKSRIDDFAAIEAKTKQRRQEHKIQLEINMNRLGAKIIECHKIHHAFGQKVILDGFSYHFQPAERLGIVGKNGTGKSTFLNLISGKIDPQGGKIVLGETVQIGYYTQAGIEVKPGQKVIEVIQEFGEYIPLKHGRQLSASQLLERFLFDRKKQYDYVEKLSGGERKRLYLCTVLIQNPNFLILDEPTNDLDVVTLGVLESFLLDFPGCLVVVSHDRYFMDKIVDHLLVFEGQGAFTDFPGNYSDYRAYTQDAPKSSLSQSAETKKEVSKVKTPQQNLQIKKEIQKIETQISVLEKEKSELELAFLNPGLSPEEMTKLSIKLAKVTDEIDEKTMIWMEYSDEMGQ
jgi:ATP-binding cassette subfamily F protein uup